ncbi:MAG: hypothetical protein A2Y33_06150 [Spirochaetes bacterium GWF1_51_8]|nr:MAG: hypothetical protein A2Y33_06150 [Spirochaetes bacterium GWF1_51_8]
MTNYSISGLIDSVKLEKFLEEAFAFSGIPMGIMDSDGKLVFMTGQQELCVNFFKRNEVTLKECRAEFQQIKDTVISGAPAEFSCPRGMHNIVEPVFCEGRVIGGVFFGQFILEGGGGREALAESYPDHQKDPTAFRDAAGKVVEISRERLVKIKEFYLYLLNVLIEDGLKEIRRADSEERFREMFQHSPLGSILLEPDGRISAMNEKAVDMIGGKNISRMPSLFKEWFPLYKSRLDAGETVEFHEEFPADQDARKSIVRFVVSPFLRDGSVKNLLLQMEDVTTLIEGLESLKRNKVFLSSILKSIPNAVVCVLDKDDRPVLVDGHEARELGWTNENFHKKISAARMSAEGKKKILDAVAGAHQGKHTSFEQDYGGRSYHVDVIPMTEDGGAIENILLLAINISGIRRMEDSLAETERRIRFLTENMADVVWSTDVTGKFTYMSPSCRHIYGYSPEELVGATISQFFGEKYMTTFQQVIRRRIESFMKGEPYFSPVRLEAEMKKKDGSLIWVELVSNPLVDSHKKLVGFAGVTREIQERKMTETALEDSRRQYRDLVEQINSVIFSLTPRGQIVYMSPALERDYGYSPGETIGKFLADYVHESEKRVFSKQLKSLKESDRTSVELRFRKRDGEYRWVQCLCSSVYTKGAISGIQGVLNDISERKRFELELEAEKERLSVTLGSMADGMISTDLEGFVVQMNRNAETLTGWEIGTAAGKPVREVFNTRVGEGNAALDLTVSLKKGKGSYVRRFYDVTLFAADGGIVRISGSVASIRLPDNSDGGTVIVFRDIGEQKRLEEEMRKRDKLESLGILAGGIAHDFNNYLTAILGNISLAKYIAQNDAHLVELLQDAEKGVFRSRELTLQLLTFSKGGQPVKRPGDLGRTVSETVRFSLRGTSVNYNFDIPESLPLAEYDEGQISQVFNNLSINSVQAMPDGGTVFVKMETVSPENTPLVNPEASKYVAITFSDNGPGIPKENLEKIFDPFFTTKASGSGIGLTTVFSIIKRHGGMIEAGSEKGRGAQFKIYLPAEESQSFGTTDEDGKIFTGEGRVLVMDDEPGVLKTSVAILKTLGYRAQGFPNGEELIEEYRQSFVTGGRIKAVILDLTIPGGIGGEEVLTKLKRIDPGVTAIVASGYSNSPVMSDYRKFGFAGMLAKPYRAEELSALLVKIKPKP